MSDISHRLSLLRNELLEKELDTFICTNLVNVRYLSGYTGTMGIAVISQDRHIFITDERYREQIKSEVQGGYEHLIITSGEIMTWVADLLTNDLKSIRVGIEADHLTLSRYMILTDKTSHIQFEPTEKLIFRFRYIKSETEINHLRKAANIIDKVYTRIREVFLPGTTELKVARWIRDRLEEYGAEDISFPTIVLFGPHSSMPHGQPGDMILEPPAIVLMDFGGIVKGYHGDFTRTVFVGNPPDEFKKAYEWVKTAQEAGVQAVKPGRTGEEVDKAARNILVNAGYGNYFIHALGHSVGLEIHESPRLNNTEKEVLKPGMVFTVEPGIYKPDWGGIRIEDMVLVTENGSERLHQSTHDLIIV